MLWVTNTNKSHRFIKKDNFLVRYKLWRLWLTYLKATLLLDIHCYNLNLGKSFWQSVHKYTVLRQWQSGPFSLKPIAHCFLIPWNRLISVNAQLNQASALPKSKLQMPTQVNLRFTIILIGLVYFKGSFLSFLSCNAYPTTNTVIRQSWRRIENLNCFFLRGLLLTAVIPLLIISSIALTSVSEIVSMQ